MKNLKLANLKKLGLVFFLVAIFIKGFGQSNFALNFSGGSQYVSIPNASQINFGSSTDFTIEAWVNLNGNNNSSFNGLVAKGGGSYPWTGYQIAIYQNKLVGELMDGSNLVGTALGLQGTTSLNDNKWHHVAMVVSRSTTTVKLYVDGNQEASVTNGAVANNITNSSNLLIGTERGAGIFYSGKIDEVRIWNVARSQSQLQNNRFYAVSPSSSNLVAYYKMDAGTGTSLADATSNANNGTFQNSPTWVASTANITLTDPGNALNFNSAANNYVGLSYYSYTDLSATGNLTIEGWINPSSVTNSNILMKGNYGYGLKILNGKLVFMDQSNGALAPTGSTTITAGSWQHVAVTVQDMGSTLAVNFFVNGVADPGNPYTSNQGSISNGGTSQAIYIGQEGAGCGCNFFSGSMDELRLWNTVRTQNQLQTNMYGVVDPASTGLVAYYRFDEGISNGTNTNANILQDLTPNQSITTLYNFALSGNTSNWIESYAMVVPVSTSATSVGSGSFTANWTAPTLGTVSSYLLDVSTSSSFTSFVSGYNSLSVTGTSQNVTGLSPSTTYYYRVRAEKASVTGQGAYSGTQQISTYSNNADLSSLSISSGSLSPSFSSGTTSYTASVSNPTSSITITPTKSQTNASIQVRVNGGAYSSVASGSPSSALSLSVGSNTIDVLVTAQDGSTTKTYSVTVTRNSNDADLTALTPSSGTLTPVFASGTTSYAASVSNATASITVTSTLSQANASIQVRVNGGAYSSVSSGVASSALSLSVGSNTIDVLVTAQDGTTTKTYTITVTRISSNADLASLALSVGTLSPSFSSSTVSYSASVSNATSSLTITPTVSDITASVQVRVNAGAYSAVTSGSASGSLSLAVGTNTVDVLVTAQDGTTTKTYSVTITRVSNDANLSALSLSLGTLSPTFSSGTTSYTAIVVTGTPSITVTPTRSQANATIQVRINGGSYSSVTSGSPSGALSIIPGSNTIDVLVTAQDGTTTKTYTVTVTTASNDANLSALTISSGTLSPVFASATTAYAVSVSNGTSSVTLTPTRSQANATIQVRVNGGSYSSVTSGSPSGALSLNVGSNTLNVLVTAQDGTTTKTYTITVIRAAVPPGNCLQFDGANDFVLVPSAWPINFGASDFTLEAWINYSSSMQDYTGILSKSGTTSSWGGFQLVLVGNKIAAEFNDGNTSPIGTANGLQGTTLLNDGKWHHIALVRSSTNVKLYVDGNQEADVTHARLGASLNVSNNFFIGVERMSSRFLNGKIDEVRIWNSAKTQSQLQAAMYNTVSASSANLMAYYNFDDGTASGTNTGLQTLLDLTSNANPGTLTGFGLSGSSSNWVESYSMVVPTASSATGIGSTSFTANWTAPAVGVVSNYLLDVSTTSNFSTFVSGYNSLSVSSTSQLVSGLSTGTTYYYRVRADKTGISGQGRYSSTITASTNSTNAYLQSLFLSTGTLNPSFGAFTTSYGVFVSNATSSLTVTATKSQANATLQIRVNGGGYSSLTSGVASSSLSLNVGTNTIDILVTAQDGSTTRTYSIKVFRAVVPPGNSLSFDGVNDNLSVPYSSSHDLSSGGALTIEAWVNPSSTSNSNILMKGAYGYGLAIYSGKLLFWDQSSQASAIAGTTTITANKWQHVAVTVQDLGSTLAINFYVNGVADPGNPYSSSQSSIQNGGTFQSLYIGQQGASCGCNFFAGNLDELRLWNTVRTPAQIQAGLYSTLSASTTGLVAYYNFDDGTAGGSNSGSNLLYDQTVFLNNATLNGFALTGSSSNWVESYAMVIPTANAASGIGSASFTANWTAPSTGSVSNYLLDVSTSATFASFVTGYNALSVAGTSSTVTGLSPVTTYYYRVSASKTSVAGQGGYSQSITVTTASTDANLLSLTLSKGSLSPSFAAGTTSYTTTQNFTDSVITVTPTRSQANATIQVRVNGGAYSSVTSGSASSGLSLNLGANTIDVLVTAQDGSTTKTYTITVTRYSNDASLSALSLSVGSFTPSFVFSTLSYSISVSNATTSTTVTPTTTHSGATIKVRINGGVSNTVSSGSASASLSLIVGINTIDVIVTSQDGVVVKTYTITVTRISNDANLTALALSSGTLSPSFASGTTSYTASVGNAITSITLTPTRSQSNSTIQVRLNGGSYSTLITSLNYPINVGVNTFDLLVTALDGVTTKTYTVAITRLSNDANITSLTPSSGTISPTFTSGTTSYFLSAPNASSTLNFTPTFSQANATMQVRVNGGSYSSAVTNGNPSTDLSLNIGRNTVDILVTAQDGVTTKTYSFTVVRAAVPPGNCIGLDGANDYVNVPSAAQFNFGTNDFTLEAWINYSNSAADYTGILTKGGSGGSWTGLQLVLVGNKLAAELSNSGGLIGVSNGLQGTTILNDGRWHHVALVRASNNAKLYVDGNLEANVTNAIIANSLTSSLNSLLIGTERNIAVYLNGKIDEVRVWNAAKTQSELQAAMLNEISPSASNLMAYFNFDDGTAGGTNTGINTVTDLSSYRNNGTLTNLALTGSSSNWVESYAMVVPTSQVATGLAATNIIGFRANWTAPAVGTVSNYLLDVSTSPSFGTYLSGYQAKSVTGTSQDVSNLTANVTYYYRVRADKTSLTGQGGYSSTKSALAGLSNANLASLSLSSGSLSPSFNQNTTSYTANVSSAASTITVTPTIAASYATIQVRVNGGTYFSVISGAASIPLSLNTGSNTIEVLVTNGVTTKTYTVTATRLSFDASLSALSTSSGTLSPVFDANTTSYTSFVSNGTSSITVTPTKSLSTSTLQGRINGGSYSALSDGIASLPFNLSVGVNTLEVLVTAQGGSPTRTYTLTIIRAASAPGNALSFDGSNDWINISGLNISPSSKPNLTMEAWVKPAGGSGPQSIVSNDNGGYDRAIVIWNGTFHIFAGRDINTGIVPDFNAWQHVAATWSGSAINFYKNGVSVFSTSGETVDAGPNAVYIGGTADNTNFYPGSIDELRIWSTIRTGSEIQANMFSLIDVNSSGLEAYYNFDFGTAAGSNSSSTTLYNMKPSGNNGTLTNFALSGSSSNWLESYAMVVPTANAASSIGSTSFTANWTAPSQGSVTNYLLDVSTSSTFASFVSGYNALSVAGTSSVVSGLSAESTYYYRVRADKTSVTGQGGYSATISTATFSSNSNLSSLTVSAGTLSPTFASGILSYSFNVSNGTTAITCTPTSASPSSTIQVRVNGGSYSSVTSGLASGSLALNVGANTIDIRVTAQDGSNKVYTLTVTRISNDANLSALSISSGSLSPTFAPGILSYSATLPNSTSSITLVGTSSDASASIQYRLNGAAYTNLTSGVASNGLSLNVGQNTIDVTVTAQDGTTTKTYTLSITRNGIPTWTGATNSVWELATNWSPASVPSSNSPVVIGASANNPILSANTTVGDITLNDTLIIGNTTLTISGTISGSGVLRGGLNSNLTIAGVAGTLNMDQSNPGLSNTLRVLTLGTGSAASLVLGNTLNIAAAGSVNFHASGTKTLNSAGNLVLKSDVLGTATLSNTQGATISGNVTVERYIPRRRAFRFLASPVNTSNYISNNWQQATQITGSLTGQNGFDQSNSGSASMFFYNATTEAWTAIPNTNATNLNVGTGYRMLIRGDRTINLNSTLPQDSAALVLRASGSLVTGNVVFGAGSVSSSPSGIPSLNASIGSGANNSTVGWSLIGNPYASAVDWVQVSKSNVSSTFATWNVNNAGRGSYVYHNGSTGSGFGASSIINSGQSIFVQTIGSNPSLTFTEACKIGSAPPNHFKKSVSNVLSVDIFIGDRPYDGLTVMFDETCKDGYDAQDFIKLINPEINFYSYLADGTKLAMNNLKEIGSETVVPLGLDGVFAGGTYELKFANQSSFTDAELSLKDKFLGKSYNLKAINNLVFNVTADSNSFGANRFELVFAKSATGIANEWVDEASFVLFPNPASNLVNISLFNGKTDRYSFTLYNEWGSEIDKGELNFNDKRTQSIAVDGLSSGIYFIRLTSAKTSQTIKFFK